MRFEWNRIDRRRPIEQVLPPGQIAIQGYVRERDESQHVPHPVPVLTNGWGPRHDDRHEEHRSIKRPFGGGKLYHLPHGEARLFRDGHRRENFVVLVHHLGYRSITGQQPFFLFLWQSRWKERRITMSARSSRPTVEKNTPKFFHVLVLAPLSSIARRKKRIANRGSPVWDDLNGS